MPGPGGGSGTSSVQRIEHWQGGQGALGWGRAAVGSGVVLWHAAACAVATAAGSGLRLQGPTPCAAPFGCALPGRQVWNPRSGACLRSMDSGYGLSALFVPGNRHALVGTKEGRLQLFDVATGALLADEEAHSGAIWCARPALLCLLRLLRLLRRSTAQSCVPVSFEHGRSQTPQIICDVASVH